MSKILFFIIGLTGFCFAAPSLGWVWINGRPGAPASAIPFSILNKRTQSFQTFEQSLPVNPQYVLGLKLCGARILAVSRWFNAVAIEADSQQWNEIKSLPFVLTISPMHRLIVSKPLQTQELQQQQESNPQSYYGNSYDQLNQLNLIQLHQNRLIGTGVTIAVMDNGFPGVDAVPGFERLRSSGHILHTYDFVMNEASVYNQTGTHGTSVLSTLAAYLPGQLIGAAYDANYLLAVTEDDRSETLAEEYHWMLAAEWADSLGADIFSTSLGYSLMDDSLESHTYADMDGNTTLITRAAEMAAARGILVVNSAGNEGNSPWRYICAPADGDSVLTVGAVNKLGARSSFSSIGPTADGRIKPDVMALGQQTTVINPQGQLYSSSGTSFSCPLISGLSACLLQASPATSGYSLGLQIRQHSNRASNPNNEYGYGIPNGKKTYEALTGLPLPEPVQSGRFYFYPNPATNSLTLEVLNEEQGETLVLEMWDYQGRCVVSRTLFTVPFFQVFQFQKSRDWPDLGNGLYLMSIRSLRDNKSIYNARIQWAP